MQGLKSMAFAAAAAARTPVRPLDVAPVRGLITASALKFLEGTPIGEAGRDAFRFRAPQGFGGNARQLMKDSIEALARKGLVRTDAAAAGASGQRRQDTGSPGPLVAIPVLRSQDIVPHCANHGPVRLVLTQAAQDGAARNIDVVVLATFEGPNGRTMAVSLDGDDRQRNAVMDKLKGWMAERQDVRELHELTRKDFDAFDAAQRECGGSERAHQMAFSFLDLDELLKSQAAPAARYGPAKDSAASPEPSPLLLCDRRVQTIRPFLFEKQEHCLQTLVEQDPSRVERLPGTS